MPNVNRIVWIIIGLLTVIGGGLALYGWSLEPKMTDGDWRNVIYRTLLFFKLDKHSGEFAKDNWALLWAQILAPAASFTLIVRVGVELFANGISRWRTRTLTRHLVVCGLGEQGSTFAENARKADPSQSVVAIELAPTEGHVSFCSRHGIRLVAGDCRDAKTLEAAGLRGAATLIVATPDDNKNLETAVTARRLVGAQAAFRQDLQAYVAIRDLNLWREFSRSDSVRRIAPNFDLRLFSLPVLAARKFFWNEPLYSYADWRGQKRIHAVFFGFDEYAANILIQMLHCCVYKSFAPSAATIFVRGAAEERDKFSRNFPEIMRDDPDIGLVGAVRFQEFDFTREPLDDALMADIERADGVTAVFVCEKSDDKALSAAVMVSDAMGRHGRWKAPVYVRMNSGEGGIEFFVAPDEARTFADIIMPFGTKLDLCDTALIDGELEKAAKRIHDTYIETRKKRDTLTQPREREESARSWGQLRETYRQSNRRAADHVKAKLASAGCFVPSGFRLSALDNLSLTTPEALAEAMAELEHRSWCAGLRIDGWRAGRRRDNARRFHDNLVPYGRLSESVKAYDRDQITLLEKSILDRRSAPGDDMSLVRMDHWIGLIGRNGITCRDAEWLQRELTDRILPRLIAAHPHACLTLVTPLAPGSDYVLTETALRFFRSKSVAHRLLVVEGVPEFNMLEDFRRQWAACAAWDGSPRPADEKWDNAESPDSAARARIAAGRRALLRGADGVKGGRVSWVIDLTEPDVDYADKAAREAGYSRAAEYIACRCPTLIAACDPEAERRPGGTNDTIARRAELVSHPPVSSWPGPRLELAIRLNLQAQTVQSD